MDKFSDGFRIPISTFSVLTQIPMLSASSGTATPEVENPLRSGSPEAVRRRGDSNSERLLPSGEKSSLNQAVSGRVSGSILIKLTVE
jgi:hypothetical protein